MIIYLKCSSYLLYFTMFLIIIHQIVGEKSAEAKVDGTKTTGIKNVKDDPVTTLKKEETTLAVNETLASTQTPEEKKNDASEKENTKKEESIPEKVVPQKPAKMPVTVPSVVNLPKAKGDKPAQVPAGDPRAGRIVLSIVGFLFVCYVILHNKNRIMGLIVEGRGGRINGRRGANVRYRRLNTTDDTAVVEAGIQ